MTSLSGLRMVARLRLGAIAASLVLVSALLSACGPDAPPDVPAIRISTLGEPDRARFDVIGLDPTVIAAAAAVPSSDPRWEQVFAVRVIGGREQNLPPVAGIYAVSGNRITFTPNFPLVDGVQYVASADLARLSAWGKGRPLQGLLTARITLPQRRMISRTVVTHIYPSIARVPANLLKFYVHFSRPMMRGEAAERIVLLDGNGKKSADAFLRLDNEFWDASGRRLTVFLDPGRIKRGLRPRRDLGGPLQAGSRYTLRIDAGWPDADGAPLLRGLDKPFVVEADDRRAPAIETWRADSPTAGTRDPIVLRSPEPMDHALAEDMIMLRDAAGARVAMTARTTDDERTIQLIPSQPWREGVYRVILNAEMEDMAGNSFRRLFDVDLTDRKSRQHENLSEVSLSVRIARPR